MKRTGPDPERPGTRGITRRALLQRLALVVVGAPLLSLRETVARAERHRRHHRGGDHGEIWIGHC